MVITVLPEKVLSMLGIACLFSIREDKMVIKECLGTVLPFKKILFEALYSRDEFNKFAIAITIRNPFPTAPVNLSGKNLVSWPESITKPVIRVEAKITEII